MKCLIFSDSHGTPYYMRRALMMHKDTEVVFFLGDGLSDIQSLKEEYPGIFFLMVKGNCDFRSFVMGQQINKCESITLLNKKITLTHGDLYGAKSGLGGLISLAKEKESDIVLFGHTHLPYECYLPAEKIDNQKPLYLFNPGSISDGMRSFGVLQLSENTVLFSHGKIER